MQRRCFDIAQYAYGKVPFYRQILHREGISFEDLFHKDALWGRLPIIEKEEVAVHNDMLISEEYLGLYARDGLISAHTSGSSGHQVDVYWTKDAYYRTLLPLWVERWHQAGIHPRDRVCYFNTILENGVSYQYEKNALIISKTNLEIDKLFDMTKEIIQFQPKWLLLHPTIALMLCKIVEERNIEFSSVCYIELTGEMIVPSLVDRLSQCFHCVIKGHYGSMEVNTIGYEYFRQKYKLFENSTYVEILDENGNVLPYGETGYIYVTSLHNRAMPFIRYGLGDMGFLERQRTEDGEIEILNLQYGKRGEFIYFFDGTRISADVLLEPIIWLSNRGEKIVYQMTAKQISKRELQIFFAIDDEIEQYEFINFYIQHLDPRILNKCSLKFDFYKSIPNPNRQTGKMMWFEGLPLDKSLLSGI